MKNTLLLFDKDYKLQRMSFFSLIKFGPFLPIKKLKPERAW